MKKTGVSLRRRRQFAFIEVPPATRVRLGLNLNGVPETERLRAATGVCTHTVEVADPNGIDDDLVGWMRQAYQQAT